MGETAAAIQSNSIPQNAFLYWIHCNRCFNVYAAKQKRHFLLACWHVACEQCLTVFPGALPAAPPSYKCPLCDKIVRGRELGNGMPSHIKELFHPMPWADNLPTFRILNFQEKHRKHFLSGMTRLKRLFMQEIESYKFTRNVHGQKFQQLQALRKERQELELRVRDILRQRPMHQKILTRSTSTDARATYSEINRAQAQAQAEPRRSQSAGAGLAVYDSVASRALRTPPRAPPTVLGFDQTISTDTIFNL